MSTATATGPAVHEWTGPTGAHFRDVREPSGTYYRDTTPRAVIEALEAARTSGARVRLFLGDRETGRDWCEEWLTCGTIGHSMGPIKIPILLANSRSHGGGAILCDCIVRLMVGGREVYRHPKYKTPSILTGSDNANDDWPFAAWVNGEKEPTARFKTMRQADRWAAFMRGERMSK